MFNRRQCLGAMAGMAVATLVPAVARSAEAAAPAAKSELPVIAGPDPHPRRPAFKAPAGAIDTHCHIFGPAAQYPFAAKRSYSAPDAPLPMFQALHETIGIRRAVIVNATLHGTDNRVVTDAIAQSNGLYRGIANIDEGMSDAELKALADAGIKGCRFVFLSRFGAGLQPDDVSRAAARVMKLGWHVDLYFEAKQIDDFLPMLGNLPVPYVIDHMGRPNVRDGIDEPGFRKLLTLAEKDERCWIKICGPERASVAGAPFDDVVPFARRLFEAAPDRVIWGSDWPHPNVKAMPNDGDLVDFIPRFLPEPALQRKLLVDNPARLFGFDAV